MTGVFVDVTQFVRQPARSGVQRALGEFAAAWPKTAEARFFYREDREVVLLPPVEFGDVVRSFFRREPSDTDRDWLHMTLGRVGTRAPRTTLDDAAAVLLPEPTYDRAILMDLSARARAGQCVAAVAYDAFPMTHPWAFTGNGHAVNSPYFRFLATASTVFATSDVVFRVLVDRLRRDEKSTRLAWLGADHVRVAATGKRNPDRASFVTVGTVEPRKRLPLALAAMERLRLTDHEASLTIVGRPGWEDRAFLSRLKRLSQCDDGIRWLPGCSDDEVADLYLAAAAVLCLGDEGFGLPVVEALAHGCPVVYAGEQPVASLLEGRGAWRIEDMTPDGIACSLLPWCDPALVHEREAAIDLHGLPTWQNYAATIANTLLG